MKYNKNKKESKNSYKNSRNKARHRLLTPVILATWEGEIRRIVVP
jgi:hypothetical protein